MAMCTDTKGKRWLELGMRIGRAGFHQAPTRFAKKVTARQSLALPLGRIHFRVVGWQPKKRGISFKPITVNIGEYRWITVNNGKKSFFSGPPKSSWATAAIGVVITVLIKRPLSKRLPLFNGKVAVMLCADE